MKLFINLIKLKNLKLSNPRNNDFENKLKSIVGKSFDESEIEKFSSSEDGLINEKIKKKI